MSGFDAHLPVCCRRASEIAGHAMHGVVVSGGVSHKLASDLTALSAV